MIKHLSLPILSIEEDESFEDTQVIFCLNPTVKETLTLNKIISFFEKAWKARKKSSSNNLALHLAAIATDVCARFQLDLFTVRNNEQTIFLLSNFEVNPTRKFERIEKFVYDAEIEQWELSFFYTDLQGYMSHRVAIVEDSFENYFVGYDNGKTRSYRYEAMEYINFLAGENSLLKASLGFFEFKEHFATKVHCRVEFS